LICKFCIAPLGRNSRGAVSDMKSIALPAFWYSWRFDLHPFSLSTVWSKVDWRQCTNHYTMPPLGLQLS